MHDIAPEVVSIADACLGGLQGRSALLMGPHEQRYPYLQLLNQHQMKFVYQEDTPALIPHLLPYVQLLINMPTFNKIGDTNNTPPMITAATIARGCERRRIPLIIFDLAPSTSVEELAGLLPTVCLYTPDDLRQILDKAEMKAS